MISNKFQSHQFDKALGERATDQGAVRVARDGEFIKHYVKDQSIETMLSNKIREASRFLKEDNNA